jgi:uncharacterized protein (DUF983 family)
MNEKSALVGIRRGLGCRCPNCGEGRLFRGYLKIEPVCKVCGNDNAVYPSDDLPPYLTILVVGHLLIPAFMWVDFTYEPATWIQAAIWLPAAIILCLLLLPLMKGATIGVCWAKDIVREEIIRKPLAPRLP